MSQSCDHGKGTSLGDLMKPGEPLLVTTGSSTGAVMMVKEECWKKGIEPILLEVDMMDVETFSAEVRSTSPDATVIISEVRRALPEVLEKVREVMQDKTRTVVVADAKSQKPGIDPKVFTDLGGHSASFP
jgi:hypothetical protein